MAVTNRYIFPSEDSGSRSPHYYSFEMSGAHIIVLGTYAAVDGINDWYVGSPQYTWLEADLKKINSTLTPWTIVMVRYRVLLGFSQGFTGFSKVDLGLH